MPHRLLAGIFALTLTAFTGCAARATYHLISANQAVEEARQAGADEFALYEFTLAEQYLFKAWEENGDNEFKDAISLSETATKWAEEAVTTVETRGRDAELDALQDDLRNSGAERSSAPTESDDPWNNQEEDP